MGRLEEVTSYWRAVPEWSLAGNDKYGDCTFVSLANFHDLVTAANGAPEVMSEAEAEHFYSIEAGFNPEDPSTDRGEVLEKVIRYWAEHGWPGDSELKPKAWGRCAHDQAEDIITRYGAYFAWVMLPADRYAPGDWDFTDIAVDGEVPGTGAHAVLVVEKAPDLRRIVTWAEVVEVSDAWWDRYAQPDAFWAEHPAWRGVVVA